MISIKTQLALYGGNQMVLYNTESITHDRFSFVIVRNNFTSESTNHALENQSTALQCKHDRTNIASVSWKSWSLLIRHCHPQHWMSLALSYPLQSGALLIQSCQPWLGLHPGDIGRLCCNTYYQLESLWLVRMMAAPTVFETL